MNDLKEQAKIIIAKGKTLNDPELIRMGLEMLDAYTGESDLVATIAVPPETKKTITPIATAGKLDMGQFTMSKVGSSLKVDKNGKKQQIYVGPRENKYHDEGEHKDIVTPDVKPTERTRKSSEQQKVKQTCEVCGKQELVLPLYVRDFYRCDSCLLKGKA